MDSLTAEELTFAEQNHSTVFHYLRYRRLNADEYYDVVIFRYLMTVRRYLSRAYLRKYSFKTIVWRAMDSAVYNHRKSEARRLSNETSCDLSRLEFELPDSFENVEERVYSKMLMLELLSKLSSTQKKLIQRSMDGMKTKELSAVYGISENAVRNRLYRIRKSLRRYYPRN